MIIRLKKTLKVVEVELDSPSPPLPTLIRGMKINSDN